MLKKLVAEFLGTAILLAAVVGSGIMAERLADGNAALARPPPSAIRTIGFRSAGPASTVPAWGHCTMTI
jgi:glycerol uptake facilitator-like aquaporin